MPRTSKKIQPWLSQLGWEERHRVTSLINAFRVYTAQLEKDIGDKEFAQVSEALKNIIGEIADLRALAKRRRIPETKTGRPL